MTDAKVTISRETLERAIEALETCTPGDYSTGHVIHPGFHELAIETALTDLRAALAAPPVEPVADRSDAYDTIDRYLRNNLDDSAYAEFSTALETVYTAHAVPLIDEQIDAIFAANHNVVDSP